MDNLENTSWLIFLLILIVILGLLVWITVLSLNIFWDTPFYRWAALVGYVLCLGMGVFFIAVSKENRDRFAFGGFTLLTIIILIWFLSLLGTRFGWWAALNITSNL